MGGRAGLEYGEPHNEQAATRAMPRQVFEIPSDATHMVVSIGGNDALGHQDLLQAPPALTADPLRLLGERVDRFEADYRQFPVS